MVVIGEQEEVVQAPDRTSYSAKNVAAASGGTALDLLRQLPSVEVDGANKVTLRASESVVVQINGRSSPLRGEQLGAFLAQIQASAVKTVEIATNPSAKNDPEGTAGIINIVLDQDAKPGLSGGFSLGGGTTHMGSLSGYVARQVGSLTVFMSANAGRETRRTSGLSFRTAPLDVSPAVVASRAQGTAQSGTRGLTLRSEFRLDERDALTFDALAVAGRSPRTGAATYTDMNRPGDVITISNQQSVGQGSSMSQDYALGYQRAGAALRTTFSGVFRLIRADNTSETDLWDVGTAASNQDVSERALRERSHSASDLPTRSFQVDMTHLLGPATKLETGMVTTNRQTQSELAATRYDPPKAGTASVSERGIGIDYAEQVTAAYTVVTRDIGKLHTQAGLRLEDARSSLSVLGSAAPYANRYGSIFPSAALVYDLSDRHQAKLSYSRRVSRPTPAQLNPSEVREDTRTVFRGNPALGPEYTDAIEGGLQERFVWGSVQLNPYFRRTANAVRYLQTIDPDGIALSTYDNVASVTLAGTDANITVKRGALSFTGGGSAYRFSSDASNLPGILSASSVGWAMRSNLTWKVKPNADVQAFASYRAPAATEGGRQLPLTFSNVALRHKLWNDQGSIALRIADPFNLLKIGYRLDDGRIVEVSERRYGQRGIFLTISRTFGQSLKLRPRVQESEVQSVSETGRP